jgi:hypothetical protein
MKNNKTNKILFRIIISILPHLLCNAVQAETYFGSRNGAIEEKSPSANSVNPSPAISTSIVQTPKRTDPPIIQGVEWVRVSYDKAENEVLTLFQRDLPKLEEFSSSLAIYEVRTSGQLPSDYHRNFKSKLERVFLTSKRIKLKQCLTCEESRLIKTEDGKVRYEAFSNDLTRPAKIANEIGVDHIVYSDLIYSAEDLQLRVKMVHPSTGQILWSKEYSTADVVKSRENWNDSDPEELSHRDSLSRVMIGEIAFTTVLSTGISYIPTINQGNGTQLLPGPSVDLFIGERYDRGRKLFGFQFGGIATALSGAERGTPLPWAVKVGPKAGWIFNPYNVSTGRWGLMTELGGLIGPGMTTGYLSIGPELKMINRFSVSILPMYILPTQAKDSEILVQNNDGSFSSSSSDAGKFGGFGFISKVSIHW